MRLYAGEKLKEAREEKELTKRHREWCAEFSEKANQELLGPDQLAWIERMDASYEDVRVVIEAGFQKGGNPSLSVDTLISCHRFFFLRNYLSEGLRLAEKTIACKGCHESKQFSRIVNMAGVFASYLGDRKRARKYVLQSYTLSKSVGNIDGAAAALVNLAISVQELGNLRKACRYYNRAAKAFRSINCYHKLFTTLTNVLGVEADLKMFEQAHAHLDEALVLQEEIKDAATLAQLHQNAAHLYLAEGQPYRTISHTLECLPTYERLGNHNHVVVAWRTAAHAAAQLGRYEAASIFLGAARKQGAALEGMGRTYDQESLDDLSDRLTKALGEQLFRSHSLIGSLMSIGQLTHELDKLRLA
jgi:tetratricopeptide (TPR) repeat protein